MRGSIGPRPATVRIAGAVSAALAVVGGVTACGGSANGSPSGTITINAQLPPKTGPVTSAQNKGLEKFTKQYERTHPKVRVDWHQISFPSITEANAALVTRASGGDDPDIVWEQYGPVNSGSIPDGIIADLTPYLKQKDPYDTSEPTWLSTFNSIDYPYMKAPNGQYQVILSSDVATGIYYSKAAFAKAGITGTPKTFAQWISDMKKLKASGITPMLFASGGTNCNPSWWERKMSSTLLAPYVSKIDVDHSQVLTGKDVATGVADGVLTTKNPAYAEIWKLLGSLRPYFASGGSQYDACATPTTSTPPLSPESLLVKGKVAMLWGGSWWGPQLNAQGYTGKWGVFSVPALTKATTQYATGVNATGTVGGPNGDGQWSITTQRADHTMTPQKTKAVVDFLEYLTSPGRLSAWLADEGQGPAFIPLVKGATLPGGGQDLQSLLPAHKPPTTVEGLLDDVLTASGSETGGRLVEQYVNGNMSFSSFAAQWDSAMKNAAQQWATQNHVTIHGLG